MIKIIQRKSNTTSTTLFGRNIPAGGVQCNDHASYAPLFVYKTIDEPTVLKPRRKWLLLTFVIITMILV